MRYPGGFNPKPRIGKISARGAVAQLLPGRGDRLVVVFLAPCTGVDVARLVPLLGVGLGPDLVDLPLQVLQLLPVLLDLAVVFGHAYVFPATSRQKSRRRRVVIE